MTYAENIFQRINSRFACSKHGKHIMLYFIRENGQQNIGLIYRGLQHSLGHHGVNLRGIRAGQEIEVAKSLSIVMLIFPLRRELLWKGN